MKKYLSLAICSLAVLAIAGCGNNAAKKATEAAIQALADSLASAQKAQSLQEQLASLPEEPVFDIVTTLGTIRVKLYSNTPKHRDNFAKLALGGYYDRLLFHRIINGFMIQGGDPLSKDEGSKDRWGTGGPGYTIPAEILPENKHKKGAFAAARRGDAGNPFRESSGSQFYIVQNEAACAQLDGAYTVFGETIQGLDVVDKIASVPTDGRDRPLTNVMIIAIRVVE